MAALILIALIIFVMLEFMSRSATEIFNKTMQEQEMLNGTITVEKIQATVTGEVTFDNLIWKDERGGTILDIPAGSFKVKLLDVLTGNFKSSTITELQLAGASISLNLDENMNVDFIRHSPDFKKVNDEMKSNGDSWEKQVSRVNKTEEELKEIGERRRRLQQSKIEKGWKNFNVEGNKLNLSLRLENCNVEVFFRERHYLLRGVEVESNINTDDEMTLKFYSGKFGGTMIGRGVSMNGKIDFKPDIPQCDLSIQFKDVDPSSLGFGLNIHDEMTLLAHFTGPVSRPIGKGKVQLNNLNLPGISFENVEGNILYEDAMLNFKDVTADVYGGKLAAYGDYNMDTRYYNIYGQGDKLKASKALPNGHLHCDVKLNITMQSKGNAKETVTFGDFVSDKGRYSVVFFDSISGKFRSEYGAINFYDVAIDMSSGYKVRSDALSIVDGKLSFAPINITNEKGELIRTVEQ